MVEVKNSLRIIPGGLVPESLLGTNIRFHPKRIEYEAKAALDRSMDAFERAANETDADDIAYMRNLWFERHPEYDLYLDTFPFLNPEDPSPTPIPPRPAA